MASDVVKLTVNIPSESLDELGDYATLHSITRTEAIRRALGLQNFLAWEIAKGAKVLLEAPSGRMREVIFP